MSDILENVLLARTQMITARINADQAAASYRAEIRKAVEIWKRENNSLRKCAEKLNITEGALRDLLRPEGTSRREKYKKRGDINENNNTQSTEN
jgi:hypothetical protein